MKKAMLVSSVLMLALNVFSQKVKKVQIGDIEDIIQKSEHPVIISFWATWCAPCLKEIPYFQETVKKYADQKIELVLVSLDFRESYPSALESFVKKKNFEASLYWLNETNADFFCPKIDPKWDGGIPATLFVNNKTNYRKFYERQLTPLQVEAEVKAQLKE
jgi:thiol-disulfide isomerase/thioredoxin